MLVKEVEETFPTHNGTVGGLKLEILDRPPPEMLGIFILASLIGFSGNCVVLTVIIGSKKFRIKTNYLIANLSIASLFYIIFGAFAGVYRNLLLAWPYGLLACQFYLTLGRLPVTILSFTTIAICTDRNRIVANPLSHRSGFVIFGQIVGIWVMSSILMIPLGLAGSVEPTISSSHDIPGTANHCIETWAHPEAKIAYSLSIFILVHLLPVGIMIRGLWRIRSKMKFLLRSQSPCTQRPDKRVRLMRNSCIFFSIFITCWLPTGFLRLPLDFPKDLLPSQVVLDLWYYNDVCGCIAYILTCNIPLLLFALSHDLRNHLKIFNCSLPLHQSPKMDKLEHENMTAKLMILNQFK